LVKSFAAQTDELSRRTGWRRRSAKRTIALNDVSLSVSAGSTLGIIGGNGAGKSTLLGSIAGTTTPDSGSVEVGGRVIPLLDLRLGFHPDLTGRQNLEFSALLLGLGQKDYEVRRDAIERFTQLGEVLDRAVRTYSTGMEARLGLALALHASPDVLLIDEVLAVGDQELRNRSVAEVRSLCRHGTTTLFVSHELDLITEVCDHAVRLSRGVVVDRGETNEVLERYGAISRSGRSAGALEGIVVPPMREAWQARRRSQGQ